MTQTVERGGASPVDSNHLDLLLLCCLQLASAVLGEHPEEPPLHLRRARDGGGGRLAARHRSDLHGRLHQDGAQTEPSQSPESRLHVLLPASSGRPDANFLSVSSFRSLRATSCFTQKRFPRTRRWWTSEFLLRLQTPVKPLVLSDVVSLQLLHRHQPDGSGQRPGHEHTPGRGVAGTSPSVLVKHAPEIRLMFVVCKY